MGSGRNSLFLAQQGWEVTGVGISDEGIRVAKKQAAKLGVKLRAFLRSADAFNFGKEQWDLIVGMYVHNTFTQNAVRIREGLKPGGIVVVEGFHREHWKPNSPGWQVSYQSNELLKAFEGLRILRYEETTAPADWSLGADALLVRLLLAQKR
jgi:2-polyprenyl-3-methyl-5-hydroxy-6-metoxy-1,4-benzoquinol methylase